MNFQAGQMGLVDSDAWAKRIEDSTALRGRRGPFAILFQGSGSQVMSYRLIAIGLYVDM